MTMYVLDDLYFWMCHCTVGFDNYYVIYSRILGLIFVRYNWQVET
jgi:hypothetical protein